MSYPLLKSKAWGSRWNPGSGEAHTVLGGEEPAGKDCLPVAIARIDVCQVMSEATQNIGQFQRYFAGAVEHSQEDQDRLAFK
ncbi:hypothetical protein [Variovorax sp. dw_954]|uniref:hypothetical protein n=1 Tax=Variovorax sp. dw_954 TaxID=2720078 RepID=UPI001BD359AB|nr:hypothetical protein [Variovorax sp. dw_954]